MPDAVLDLDAAAIRRRLAGCGLPEDPLAVDLSAFTRPLSSSAVDKLTQSLKPAGVLVPIVMRPAGLTVLLTERSAALRHHAGQVSFPGGSMEAHDPDLVTTALRETEEEVGIGRHLVEIAGCLRPMPTITGFAVTPVVGLVAAAFQLRLDPSEVDDAFEVPLGFLMDARNEIHSEREFRGERYPVTSIEFDGHTIWGATATIIRSLRNYLYI